jgi:hypothetical protein
MKKYLFTLFLLLFVFTSSVSFAATTDFVANGDITVSSVAGAGAPNVNYDPLTANLLIMSGSQTESWTYNAGTFTVTNPDSTNPFQVGSADSSIISIRVNDNAGAQAVCADNTTPGTSYVTLPTASGTYNVYGSSSVCVAASTGSSSSSSGSSSGKSGARVAFIVVPSINANTNAQSTASVTTSTTGVATLSSGKFTRTLNTGSVGSDVLALQKFLNNNGFVITSSGAGSLGKETTTFGGLTKAALIKFQLSKGIIATSSDVGAGTVGPKTRGVLNAGASASVSAPSANAKQAAIDALEAQIKALLEQIKNQ